MTTPAPPSDLSDDSALQRAVMDDPLLRREAIRRVLASPGFQRSHRLSQLLEYIAAHTLARDFEGLKESAIGQQVFSRPPSYNASDDNIVRASVRQLRRKLEEYYAARGADDEMRLVIPKGSYAFAFQAGEPRASITPPLEDRKPTGSKRLSFLLAAVAGACAGAFLASLFFVSVHQAKSKPVNAALGLLNPAPGQRLLVVVPDFGIQLYRRLTGRTMSLQDYLGRRFLEPSAVAALPPDLAASATRLFGDPATQGFVLDLIPRFAAIVAPYALSVRHPSTLSVEDFAKDNALLISGPNGNPWVQLFDRTLNFQIVNDPGSQESHIENRQPSGSERKEYYNFTDASGTVVCFARIAYLHGLSPASRVLLAGGPHNASTEAASRFLTSPDSLSSLLRLFHAATSQQLPSFEILIESRALGNAPWTMTIAAYRVVGEKER